MAPIVQINQPTLLFTLFLIFATTETVGVIHGIVEVGRTPSKAFFVPGPNSSVTDFPGAGYSCGLMGLRLASLESAEELAVLDKYLRPNTEGSEYQIAQLWTSGNAGLDAGSESGHWSSGKPISLAVTRICRAHSNCVDEDPTSLLWQKCVLVQTACSNSSDSDSDVKDCLRLIWADCRKELQYLCEWLI